MKLLECHPLDESFVHVDEQGKQTTWNATQLYHWCVANKIAVTMVHIDAAHAETIAATRGVERERLERLATAPAEVIVRPILFVHDPTDDSHLLVDGSHRYVLLYGWEIPQIRAYIPEYEQVRQFIVEDAPVNEDVMRHSYLNLLRSIFGDR